MIIIKTSGFNPESIVLKDDAFHNVKFFGNVETWYYDAIFDNKYSVVCLVNAIQFLKVGVILTGLFIYKDAKLIKSTRDRTLITHFHGSMERPYIVINGREIINGDVKRDSKDWIYHIVMGDKKIMLTLVLLKKWSHGKEIIY